MNDLFQSSHYRFFSSLTVPFCLPASEASDSTEQLLIAGKKGAVRELFEETGLDLRSELHRVKPLRLKDRSNIHKDRLFFVATVEDTDFNGKVKPIDVITADHLKVSDVSLVNHQIEFQLTFYLLSLTCPKSTLGSLSKGILW